MNKFRSTRRYYFREAIAALDMETKGVMVLTWKQARHYWQLATFRAQVHAKHHGWLIANA